MHVSEEESVLIKFYEAVSSFALFAIFLAATPNPASGFSMGNICKSADGRGPIPPTNGPIVMYLPEIDKTWQAEITLLE